MTAQPPEAQTPDTDPSWTETGAIGHEAVKFEVPAQPRSVRDARDRMHKIVTGWGFGLIADDLILCLSEALTNSITHAKHGGAVTIQAWRHGTMVHVDVLDRDQRSPRLTVPVEAALPSSLPPERQPEDHGRGMYLIATLSSRWGVETRPPGKCVWFEKDTEPGHPNQAAR